MFLLFTALVSCDGVSTDDPCLIYSTNCESCMGNRPSEVCGWCKDTEQCLNGTEHGPVGIPCTDWTFRFNMQCHLSSTTPLSTGARIGIGVASGVIAVVTIIFWVFIFPHCISKPKIENMESSDE